MRHYPSLAGLLYTGLAGLAVTAGLLGCGPSKHSHTKAAEAPTTSHAAPAPVTSTTRPSPSTTSTAGATNVRLPATFTIEPGERLSPTYVGAPAGVTILLTMISADAKAHVVSVGRHVLSVPAGGRASLPLTGLVRGNYALTVDGTRRGTLIVGVQPGP